MYFMEGTEDSDVMIYHGDCEADELAAMSFVRKDRDRRLLKSDKFLVPDFVFPAGLTLERVLVYRQLLRDLPATVVLSNVIFPKL